MKWKPITGYIDLYEVCEDGRIRSLPRWVRNSKSGSKRKVPAKILTPSKERGGYLHVQLWRNNRSRPVKVHKLVIRSFVGECPEGLEICHRDGDPTNNRLENLKYDTRVNNHRDKHRHGTAVLGEKNAAHVLTHKEVEQIRLLYSKGGITQDKLAEKFGVTQGTIHNIVRNKAWTHVKGTDCSKAGRKNVKLTTTKVRRLRKDYATGNFSKAELGRRYGITATQIRNIVTYQSWPSV